MNDGTPSSSAGVSAPSSSRKERGAIAAQACESCRQRKQRCSEERPKCASCMRMKLDCQYREPLPTKKDKTLVEILDRLKSLEGKVDTLTTRSQASSSSTYETQARPQVHDSSSIPIDLHRYKSWPPSRASSIPLSIIQSPPQQSHYAYVSGAFKMLSWPFVQRFFEAPAFKSAHIDILSLQKDGPGIMMGARLRPTTLPLDTLDTEASHPLSAIDPSISGPQLIRPGLTKLNWETIRLQSKAYFNTFNLLYPIVDTHSFQTQILPVVTTHGFDDSMDSTLALLVLALGEVAKAGVEGEPLRVHQGRPSGMKGGTLGRPPGLLLFNEARKRMGFNLTDCSVENVQLFALAALYYSTCCLHIEFWRMQSSASIACQALLTSNPDELNTPRGDLIRRLFWHCSIMEAWLNLEFNIPSTGLHSLEDLVGLPDFSAGDFTQEDYLSNQTSHFREHFASQIVLRRLSVEFNTTLTNAFGGIDPISVPRAESLQETAISTMKQLAAQLDQWRGLLPPYLSWADVPFDSFLSGATSAYSSSVHTQQVLEVHSQITFTTTDMDNPTAIYLYAEDIQAAMLRTRYLYVKYLIHRPFMFKALHHPEHMMQEDAEGVAICLQSCLLWPIAMSPVRDKKRLIPCLVFWSQNFFGILVLLHLSQQVPILMRIRSDLLGDQFALDAMETIHLYIDWIRDLKDIDTTALWCWTIIENLFPLEI